MATMRDPHPQLASLWLKHTQDSPQSVGFLEGVRAMYLASKTFLSLKDGILQVTCILCAKNISGTQLIWIC